MGRKKKLTDQQKIFLDQFVLTGNGTESAKKAGYSTPKVRGSELKRSLKKEIMEATKEQLGSMAPELMRVAVDIAINEENPKIRLSAVQDLLDRAGYKAIEHTKTEVHNVDSQTTAEMEAELGELLSGKDGLRLVQ